MVKIILLNELNKMIEISVFILHAATYCIVLAFRLCSSRLPVPYNKPASFTFLKRRILQFLSLNPPLIASLSLGEGRHSLFACEGGEGRGKFCSECTFVSSPFSIFISKQVPLFMLSMKLNLWPGSLPPPPGRRVKVIHA